MAEQTQVDRIEANLESLSQFTLALGEQMVSIRQDLQTTARLTQQNAIAVQANAEAIAQLREAQRESQAGQEENRAILNQLLRRDQERGQ